VDNTVPEGTGCALRHGTSDRFPSSVVMTSRASASGINVINSTARITNATLISRRRRALTFPVGRTRAATRSIVPGPQRRSNSCSAAPSRACSAGLPWAWTRPSRRTRAGVIATILHQATRSPVLIGPAPATTDADRSSPSEPARTGQPSAQTGTATIRVAAPIPSTGVFATEDSAG
jgi:hypothetical protein